MIMVHSALFTEACSNLKKRPLRAEDRTLILPGIDDYWPEAGIKTLLAVYPRNHN